MNTLFFIHRNTCCTVAILFAALSSGFAQSNRYSVIGRVMERDIPVAGATVFLEPQEDRSVTIDRFVDSAMTDRDGRFRIERSELWMQSAGQPQLFVALDKTVGTFSLLDPPFDSVRRMDNSFEGIPIPLGPSRVIDIGDIGVRFRYGKVELVLDKRSFTSIPWKDVYLLLRNRHGQCVDYGSLSPHILENYLSESKSLLSFALPEGRWRVELHVDSRMIARTEYFSVRGDGVTTTKAQLSKNRGDPTEPGCLAPTR